MSKSGIEEDSEWEDIDDNEEVADDGLPELPVLLDRKTLKPVNPLQLCFHWKVPTLVGKDTKLQVDHIRVLMDQKKNSLDCELPIRRHLFNADFTLNIELVMKTENGTSCRPLHPVPIWRRLKCSGGLNLRQFQDRVLAPGFGWSRNYHGYLFIDPTDGAQWGPIGSSSVDMIHLSTSGHIYMSDLTTNLGQVLHVEGGTVFYLHDLGDRFLHRITLESIAPAEDSNSVVELLDGGGPNPPEDSFGFTPDGCEGFEKLCALSGRALQHCGNEVMRAMNYEMALPFDPSHFDIEHNRCALREALRAPASIVRGAKVVIMSPTQSLYRSEETEGNGFKSVMTDRTYALPNMAQPLEQLVRTKRDPRDEALCRVCGSPHNISFCSKCLWAPYCSIACQRSDWNESGGVVGGEGGSSVGSGARGHKVECKKSVQGRRPLVRPPKLRFKVGDTVECRMSDDEWVVGRVVALDYQGDGPPVKAYQVEIYDRHQAEDKRRHSSSSSSSTSTSSSPSSSSSTGFRRGDAERSKGKKVLIYAPYDHNAMIRRTRQVFVHSAF